MFTGGKKNQQHKTKKSRSLQGTAINLNELDWFVMCFPKNKLFRSQSAGLAKVPSEENNPQELYARSRRELPGWQQQRQQ